VNGSRPGAQRGMKTVSERSNLLNAGSILRP
jgi:hypothetical protein